MTFCGIVFSEEPQGCAALPILAGCRCRDRRPQITPSLALGKIQFTDPESLPLLLCTWVFPVACASSHDVGAFAGLEPFLRFFPVLGCLHTLGILFGILGRRSRFFVSIIVAADASAWRVPESDQRHVPGRTVVAEVWRESEGTAVFSRYQRVGVLVVAPACGFVAGEATLQGPVARHNGDEVVVVVTVSCAWHYWLRKTLSRCPKLAAIPLPVRRGMMRTSGIECGRRNRGWPRTSRSW